MTVAKTAQHIEVLEFPMAEHMVIEPEDAVMVAEMPEDHDLSGLLEFHEHNEIAEPEHHEHDFVVSELPGVDELDPELEKTLEVSEDTKEDKADLKATKPMLKWDWEACWKKDGANGFFAWSKDILDSIPKHSGYDEAGCNRAKAYLERLLDEVSKAMKKDHDGELDADKVEKICAEAEHGIERLEARVEKIRTSKKSKKTKKADEQLELVKTAQKAPTVVGIVITVPLFISRIARVIINGMVSAGHDCEVLFDEQVKKYKLNDREQAELMQHLMDMNVPMRQDRFYMRNEDVDTTDGKGDWMSNYPA